MRSMRRWRAGLWLGLILALAMSLLGWQKLLRAPWPVIGCWLALVALFALFLFLHFASRTAPAQEWEQGDLDWAFLRFLFGKLRSLGAVDAGQPRNPSEPRIGPGLWLIDARSAIAIEREGRVFRIAGPGLAWVEAREQVVAFVDLRPQSFPRGTSSTLRVRTLDGIPLGLEIQTSAAFLPQSPPEDCVGCSPHFFPTRPMRHAIARALRAARVEEDRTLHWFELPYEIARSEISARIGNLLFDQLFLFTQPENAGRSRATPLAQLADEIRAALNRDLAALGIRTNRLRLTLREVPEEAQRQRVEVWRSQWATRLARWIGLAESEVLMEYARARYASQMEMLEAMNKVLAAYQDVSPEVILLHFLETLDNTVRHSGLALPAELRQLWEYLRGRGPSGT